jgi:hypothetical protein
MSVQVADFKLDASRLHRCFQRVQVRVRCTNFYLMKPRVLYGPRPDRGPSLSCLRTSARARCNALRSSLLGLAAVSVGGSGTTSSSRESGSRHRPSIVSL